MLNIPCFLPLTVLLTADLTVLLTADRMTYIRLRVFYLDPGGGGSEQSLQCPVDG